MFLGMKTEAPSQLHQPLLSVINLEDTREINEESKMAIKDDNNNPENKETHSSSKSVQIDCSVTLDIKSSSVIPVNNSENKETQNNVKSIKRDCDVPSKNESSSVSPVKNSENKESDNSLKSVKIDCNDIPHKESRNVSPLKDLENNETVNTSKPIQIDCNVTPQKESSSLSPVKNAKTWVPPVVKPYLCSDPENDSVIHELSPKQNGLPKQNLTPRQNGLLQNDVTPKLNGSSKQDVTPKPNDSLKTDVIPKQNGSLKKDITVIKIEDNDDEEEKHMYKTLDSPAIKVDTDCKSKDSVGDRNGASKRKREDPSGRRSPWLRDVGVQTEDFDLKEVSLICEIHITNSYIKN